MNLDDIALTLHPEVGCKTAIHLLDVFGTASAVFSASEEELRERGEIKDTIAHSIVRHEYHRAAEQEVAFITRNHIRAIASTDAAYPQRLLECPDYPHVLYVKGEADLNVPHSLSIVGTRKITPYGTRVCEKLVAELAEGFPDIMVISGLAYGVDIAAHRAALQHQVVTVGVLGHPLTHIYPPAHTESARRIVQQGGALISEYPSTAKPDKSGFVQRNRLIAGLSDGTVIVESAAKGGSLITVEMADGYQRTVMAVPGRIGDRYSEGTNRLIRTLKGVMVECGTDIAEALNWECSPHKTTNATLQPELFSQGGDPPGAQSGVEESPSLHILAFLGEEPVSLDELSLRSGIAIQELPALLLELELANRIRSLPGSRYLKF